MSKYIKFSNIIINTAFIKHVEIDKLAEKFTIHLSSSPHSGAFFLGSGYFHGHSSYIWASKAEHPESYATVEKWIHSMKCVSDP